MTRISDRSARTGATEQPEIISTKIPQLHHLAVGNSNYMLVLLAAESEVSRREIIGCMRSLLRAPDRIREGF